MNLLRFTLLLILLQSCTAQNQKINGVSFVASPNEATQEHVTAVLDVNANYAAIMPFGFIRNLDSSEIIFDTDRQWFGETSAGASQYIDLLRQNNMKVMMKPQIWIWRGEFTGYLTMNTETDWKALEASYTNFIMTYAKLAQEKKVPLLCIGTELEQFIVHRPDYWKLLIQEIKGVYDGKLTYAANWDEYKRVPFWKDLDFIGVDAYFPISESKTPTLEEAKAGWEPWIKELKEVAVTNNNTPVLFTEYGYRSVDFAGKEPWRSDRSMTQVNLEAQTNLTQALYDIVYQEDWFQGGFIWKWFINHEESGGADNNQFTPQNKPVELVIKKRYAQD